MSDTCHTGVRRVSVSDTCLTPHKRVVSVLHSFHSFQLLQASWYYYNVYSSFVHNQRWENLLAATHRQEILTKNKIFGRDKGISGTNHSNWHNKIILIYYLEHSINSAHRITQDERCSAMRSMLFHQNWIIKCPNRNVTREDQGADKKVQHF